MTRYGIIAAAILVGVFIGWIISRQKPAASDEVLVEQKPMLKLLPWIATVITLMVGLYFLSDRTSAPISTEYQPAIIKDGVLKPGQFGPVDKDGK